MKFSCNKNSLLNEIAVAQGIISSRNTMSILSNVLLEVKEGNLSIKATDLKIGYETSIPVDMEEAGYERGLEDGRKEGIEEGRKNNSIQIAKEMKKEGMNSSLIAKLTKLSLNEIETL